MNQKPTSKTANQNGNMPTPHEPVIHNILTLSYPAPNLLPPGVKPRKKLSFDIVDGMQQLRAYGYTNVDELLADKALLAVSLSEQIMKNLQVLPLTDL